MSCQSYATMKQCRTNARQSSEWLETTQRRTITAPQLDPESGRARILERKGRNAMHVPDGFADGGGRLADAQVARRQATQLRTLLSGRRGCRRLPGPQHHYQRRRPQYQRGADPDHKRPFGGRQKQTDESRKQEPRAGGIIEPRRDTLRKRETCSPTMIAQAGNIRSTRPAFRRILAVTISATTSMKLHNPTSLPTRRPRAGNKPARDEQRQRKRNRNDNKARRSAGELSTPRVPRI